MSPERRPFIAVAAAVGVALAVAAVVVVFGIRNVPSFPSLTDHPDRSITGVIAFIDRSNPDSRCINIVDAAGGPVRHVPCDVTTSGSLTWTPDGRLQVRRFAAGSSQFASIDPATATVTTTGTTLPNRLPGLVSPSTSQTRTFERLDGSTVRVRGHDGRPELRIVKGSSTRTILKAKGPDDYGFDTASWSPDGRWILVRDSEDRLIIVAADGPPQPRVLATHASNPVWYQPGF